MERREPKGGKARGMRRMLKTPGGLVIGEVVRMPGGRVGLAVKRKSRTDTIPMDDLLAQVPHNTTA